VWHCAASFVHVLNLVDNRTEFRYQPYHIHRRISAVPRRPAKPSEASGRTFAYVRVSSDEQVQEGQSLQVQVQQLRGWAQMHHWQIAETFTEPGVSAGIPFNERPEGSRLWQLVQRGDAVVASKLDRMFRSAADCLGVVEAFKARGVSLYLLDLNGGADDVSGNGIARLFLTIVSAFAEFERDRLGERIRATKLNQRAEGKAEIATGTSVLGSAPHGSNLREPCGNQL
jgi:DNA invertase Pin-like site-specific DNA recombinase